MTVGELADSSVAPESSARRANEATAKTSKPRAPGSRSARLSVTVFALVECSALVTWLVIGRFQWFYNDDWDFIAGRKVLNISDLFRPHNEHWVTVPFLAYRALYLVFGLRSFFPYRLMIVLVHLVAAALLLVVLRRAGVRPWIATAAASLFAFFGSGSQDILVPFQIAFTGALVMGLIQLILSDHDGPLDRRDRLGLLAGFIGLMCSGIAVSMTLIVGLAVLLRRGWRPAAFHTVPLATIYVIWFAATGHTGYITGSPSAGAVIAFVAKGMRFSLGAIVKTPALIRYPVLTVIAIVLLGGLVLAWTERRRTQRLHELAVPCALLAGSMVFLAITAAGREDFGTNYAGTNRYVYLAVAMMLPAVAVAVEAFVTRWRLLLPIAIALFLVGIPANIHAAQQSETAQKPIFTETKKMMLSLPRDPFAQQVPRSIRPEQAHASWVTVGWLLDGVKSHRIPALSHVPFLSFAQDNFRLAFEQRSGSAPTTRCQTLSKPLFVTLRKGDVVEFSKNTIQVLPANGVFGLDPPLLFFPADGTRLVLLKSPGRVRFEAVTIGWNWRTRRADTHQTPVVCTSR